jgi:subtilisin family serine protease
MTRSTFVRRSLAALLAVVFALAFTPLPAAGAGRPHGTPERLLVRFKPGAPASVIAEAHARVGAREIRSIPRLGVRVVQLPPGRDANQVAKAYSRSSWVEFAEADEIVAADLVPNDPLYTGQWGLPAVSAPQAWDVTSGSSGVVIAVLDTGMDMSHPDLTRRAIPGYDFVNRDADASDDHGHGTLVAGIAGADTNNAAGVAGVDWAAKIMPVKVLDASGSGYMSTVAEGIVWAADRGAAVINMSLSGATGTSTLKSACDYAYAKGVVLVAAAGNEGTDAPRYPAAYDSVISVGSLSGETRSSYSSYGSTLELMAPGGLIYTTQRGGAYVRASGTSMAAPFVSGLTALMRAADPAVTPTRIRQVLADTATDLGSAGWDAEYGWGRIDMAKALAAVRGSAPPASEPAPAPEPEPAPAPQPPADTTAPTVAITSPVNGATASGKVTIVADAKDDTAVTRVELYANGKLIATLNAAPYQYVWNVRKLRGSYTLTARAYDAADNCGSSPPITITIVK